MEHEPTNIKEQIPETFPIVEDTGTYYSHGEIEDEPESKENEIVHFKQQTLSSWSPSIENYLLSKTIGRHRYVFYLRKGGWEGYSLSWKTKEYEYARTSLNEEETETLFKTVRSFLNSVYPEVKNAGETIRANSAPANYTAEEIDRCRDEILASPKNTLTREDMTERYKGSKIFELYEDLFEEPFEGRTGWSGVKGIDARDRYYRVMFKKHVPDWKMDKELFGDLVFQPQRNDNSRQKPKV